MIALFCQNGQKRAKNTLFFLRLPYRRYLPAVKFLLINCHSLSDRGFRDLSRAELDNKFGDDDCAMIVDKQNYLR